MARGDDGVSQISGPQKERSARRNRRATDPVDHLSQIDGSICPQRVLEEE